MMKTFLKLKNPFLVISRPKTKSANVPKTKSTNGPKGKKALERLDYESNLLFGNPLKKTRRKSGKNVKLITEEDPEECIYYDLCSKGSTLSNDTPIDSPSVNENSIQPFEKVESLLTADENNPIEKSNTSDKSVKATIKESALLFPLFNEAKKEYVPTQTYNINPIMNSSFRSFPTVTTILTETMSDRGKAALNNWKANQVEELGQDKFDEQQRKQLQSRNILMKLIKRRLLGAKNEDLNIAPEFQGCWKSLDCVFPLFSHLKTMEKMVVHPELKYKGMIDSIIEFKNKPVLVSWKKSSKIKSTINMTFDAPVQIAAYIGALNYDENYPFRVEECLLVMSYEDGSKADIFHLKKENCFHYWKLWLDRLKLYQSLHEQPESKSELNVKIEIPKISKIDTSVKENSTSVKENSTSVKENSSPPNTGFNTSAYTTFADILTKPKKKDGEIELTFPTFPIYNPSKHDYVPGHLYEMNPVKQETWNYYPAVTTILSETKSDEAKLVLERWKNNLIAEMGQEGFDQYQKNLLDTGTKLHSLIQQRLMGADEKDLDIKPELEGCWKSLQNVFPLFADIKVTESYVVHEKLKYKGIIDCVAEFRGKPVLIDWKKTDKIKSSISQTYDAPLQIAAYIGAANYDNLYPFKIEEGLLIFSYMDGTKADIFHLNKDSCQRYWNLWQQRLHQYQKMAKANDLRIEY